MFLIKWHMVIISMSVGLATINVKHTGWLDRLVEYHKRKFIKDVQELVPVQIDATIERRPTGYVDATGWNYESVARLLALIAESETARPVHAALRRMLQLQPSRRSFSKAKSLKYIPSLQQQNAGDFYYDIESQEMYFDPLYGHFRSPEAVVVVRNPVEARLPSAQISVQLLKEILMNRALAARQMPPTTKSRYTWIPMNKTTKKPVDKEIESDTKIKPKPEAEPQPEVTPDTGVTTDTGVTPVTGVTPDTGVGTTQYLYTTAVTGN